MEKNRAADDGEGAGEETISEVPEAAVVTGQSPTVEESLAWLEAFLLEEDDMAESMETHTPAGLLLINVKTQKPDSRHF